MSRNDRRGKRTFKRSGSLVKLTRMHHVRFSEHYWLLAYIYCVGGLPSLMQTISSELSGLSIDPDWDLFGISVAR